MPTHQTRDIEPMLGQCCPAVYDVGPTFTQHWFNVSCLLGTEGVILRGLYSLNNIEVWCTLCARYLFIPKSGLIIMYHFQFGIHVKFYILCPRTTFFSRLKLWQWPISICVPHNTYTYLYISISLYISLFLWQISLDWLSVNKISVCLSVYITRATIKETLYWWDNFILSGFHVRWMTPAVSQCLYSCESQCALVP